ncbi:MAG: HAD-IIB family hydrolase [Patescibacteria group bacterium]
MRSKNLSYILFLDIDGTLTNNLLPISQPVKHAISNINKDLYIVLITGRSMSSTISIANELGISCYAITEGGARIIDAQKRTIILSCIIEKTAKKVASLCIKLNIEFNICIEGKSYMYPNKQVFSPQNFSKISRICVLNINQSYLKNFENYLRKIGNVDFFQVKNNKNPLNWNLDITGKNINKKTALKKLLNLAIFSNSKTIGVGDGHNDIEFIKNVETKIAMGNAVDELKKIADYTVDTVTNDGIVDVVNIVKRLLKNLKYGKQNFRGGGCSC